MKVRSFVSVMFESVKARKYDPWGKINYTSCCKDAQISTDENLGNATLIHFIYKQDQGFHRDGMGTSVIIQVTANIVILFSTKTVVQKINKSSEEISIFLIAPKL